MTPLDYGILIAYVAGTVLLGSVFSKGQSSLKEFFLGNRNIPWWAAAFSGIATIVSGASYLGGPGQAYRSDYTFLQYRLATPVAIFVICFILLPFFYKLDVFTAYEYLERRFDLKTRLLASTLFLLLKCFYLGIVIYAPALVLAEMTGWSMNVIIISTGALTAIYTMLGGIRAVIWTDTLQLGVLLGGLVVSIGVLFAKVDGGLTGLVQHAAADSKFRFFDFSTSLSVEVTFWGGLIGGAFYMISQFGVDQSELQRFLTTASLRRSQAAVASSMLVAAAIGVLLFFTGTALYVFYSQRPELGAGTVQPDRVFPKFIIEELPPGVTGLVIAGVLSASMSTISSVLNSLTTVSVSDIYSRITGQPGSVITARLTTALFGAVSTAIALFADRLGTILVATTKVSNLFGGTLVGVFLLGICVRRANGHGAFGGALAGFSTVLAVSLLTQISWMWYGPISAVVAFCAGFGLSRFFAAPPKHKIHGLTLWRSAMSRSAVEEVARG
jgi:SSS family transporter